MRRESMMGRMPRDEPTWANCHDPSIPIRVGVSACLLGGEVRFDGGHKRDRYLTDVLGECVVWVPVCPEIEIGMGIPRPAIQIRASERGESLVERESGADWTDRMREYADARVSELADTGLDGFILKKGSPSCGMGRVPVYGHAGGTPSRGGVGHFAQALSRGFADCPLEEEGRLRDAALRERFIDAIFSHNRWRVLVSRGVTRGRLVAFHQAHKMLILAHDQAIYREMGCVVARCGQVPDEEVYAAYHPLFVAAFRKTTTVAQHVNVLEHLLGHLKDKISESEKREVSALIEDYRQERIPLLVVTSLLRSLVTAHDVTYVQGQLYLDPHPRELKLRDHV